MVTPVEIIEDLQKYIDLYGIKISKEAKKTLEDIEIFSFKCNSPCDYRLFFSRAIRNTRELQKLFYRKNINPSLVALTLEIGYYREIDTKNNYQKGTRLYSYRHEREKYDKTAILDKALQHCVKDERATLENKDIMLAAIDYFEGLREYNKEQWRSNDLDMEHITLAHVYGMNDKNLLVKLEEIREVLLNFNHWKTKIKLN